MDNDKIIDSFATAGVLFVAMLKKQDKTKDFREKVIAAFLEWTNIGINIFGPEFPAVLASITSEVTSQAERHKDIDN
jgi:hypothetical protein